MSVVQTLTISPKDHSSYTCYKRFLQPRRWLTLYEEGVFALQTRELNEHSLSPIQKLLPEDLLLEVFLRSDNPADIGRAACCCRQWRRVCRSEAIWKHHSLVAWKLSGRKFNRTCVEEKYGGSWLAMWMLRPRLRLDGVYVSRNTYVKPGMAGWSYTAPVHLVVYYRYYLFRPEGSFVYKTSPHPLRQVYKELLRTRRTRRDDHYYLGTWELNEDKLSTVFCYDNKYSTESRTEGSVRSTVPGANNRIDVARLATTYEHGDRDIEADGGGSTVHREHMRRMHVSPYVFVPAHEFDTHAINNPVEVMDYYDPG
mmetsp:Transcript_34878/g.76232  ORF Transcript_34878/g.76232 Transcript_34878/m.76232 type:complete len:312 (-) Transcript_34878:246-1181(-)|eukprot:CAMPEP_0118942552 /NCGR_PEP_ID=MMETSP1169-20130426/36395_1 /TAXON_ID=36882 /ORGANISM="Pyramimonas obovata, Strain CCMP722" /LENGTH=311 /DNA_ID=CAMNT_0006887589 /DNA_START=313 /DNA_END=1248 /DNA_ORIENTATION=-